MRCPKCGYISFDQIEECLKCKKSLKTVNQTIRGTVCNAPAPIFLKFTADPPQEESDTLNLTETPLDSFEIEDPDLEVLVDEHDTAEDETDIRLTDVNTAAIAASAEKTSPTGKEDDASFDILPEIPLPDLSHTKLPKLDSQIMNLSLEKDDDEPEIAPKSSGKAPALTIPDELADISDLAPPGVELKSKDGKHPANNADLDLNLDLDFDLEIDGFDDEEQTAATAPAKPSSPPQAPERSYQKKTMSSVVNMDEELNFELDLGGLSLHNDPPTARK